MALHGNGPEAFGPAPFASGGSWLTLAQAALITLSTGTFFPAEVLIGFAAVPCFLHYFWLVWLAVPSVDAGLGARGALPDPT